MNVSRVTRHEFDVDDFAGPLFFTTSTSPPLAYCVLLAPAMLDGISGSLERYMDLLSARQKIVASNIANADTPGYKTKDLNFQSEFQAAVSEPQAVEVGGLPAKNDGNNVSLDREARLLSENALRFNFASGLLRGQIRLVKEAIQEGKSA